MKSQKISGKLEVASLQEVSAIIITIFDKPRAVALYKEVSDNRRVEFNGKKIQFKVVWIPDVVSGDKFSSYSELMEVVEEYDKES